MFPSQAFASQNQTQTDMQSQSQMMPASDDEPRLFQNYTLNPKAWDELFAGPGKPHDFCRVLLDRLGGLTVRDFLDRPAFGRSGLHQPWHHLLGLLRPPRRRRFSPST